MPEDIFDTDEIQIQADVPENVTVNEYGSTVEVGTVTTLDYGENATVTNTGTADHAILNFGIPRGSSGAAWGILEGNIEDQTDLWTILTGLRTDVDAKAPAASAALTGTPTAPTAIDGTNTDQIATTKFVQNAINLLKATVVNNMLKIMDWSNVQEASITRNTPFTVPADGYICFSLLASGGYYCAINNKVLGLRSGTAYYSYISTGVPVSVKQGDIITTINVDAGNTVYAVLYFIPFKS